jgi:hypothetical protein
MSPRQQRTGCRHARWAAAARRAVAVVLEILIAGGAAAQPPDPSLAVGLPPPASDGLNAAAAPLPVNLVVPNSIVPIVWSMWLRSPTFRRQCLRLAEHPEIVVQFELTSQVERGSGRTRLKRRPSGIAAAVQIGFGDPHSYVELIAHELEHVLEQLDGTNLPVLERLGVDGVVREKHDHYDTMRARSIGRAVARESHR